MRKSILYFLLLFFVVSLSSCTNDDEESEKNVVLYEVYSENPTQKLVISVGRSWGTIVTGRWESAERTDKSECDICVGNYYDGVSSEPLTPPYYFVKIYVNGKLRTIKQARNRETFYVALKKSSPYWNQQKDTFLDLNGKSFIR